MGHGTWLMLWVQEEVVAFDPISMLRSWPVRVGVMLVIFGLVAIGIMSRSK